MPPNNRNVETIEELAKEVSDGFTALLQTIDSKYGNFSEVRRKVESEILPRIERFMHLVDGNGVPPLAVRLAVAEQTIKRHDEQFAAQRNWIAGLSVGLILAVAGAVVTLVLK